MKPVFVCAVMFLIMLSGCDRGPKSGYGFRLPDGDIDRGQVVFVEFECNACHSVGNVEQLTTANPDSIISVKLGGKVTAIQTYGQLVSSIVNPSHRLVGRYPRDQVSNDNGESLMRNYNDEMTVTQLIHLVAFLQSNYELRPYQGPRDHLY